MRRYKSRFIAVVTLLISTVAVAQNIDVDYLTTDNYRSVQELIQNDGLIERAAQFIDRQIQLKRPIKITVGSEDGPAFDLDADEMLIPYPFVEQTIRLFLENGYLTDEAEIYALDVLEHTLYHEFGHGLIDQLQIPFTGKEEDAVDELAGLLVIATNIDASEIILSAADSFQIYDQQIDGFEEQDFAGLHSLDIQRFYNLVCMTYAQDPVTYASLVDEVSLPEDRAEQCIADYPRQLTSWLTLLAPYLATPEQFTNLFYR